MQFKTEKISEHITRIHGFCTEFMYLIEGSKAAVLIDTGCGFYSLKDCIHNLTNKPLKVLITHGHVDHAMGANEAQIIQQHLIDPEICIRCNTCESICPVSAITHDSRNYVVDVSKCNWCNDCISPCPTGSIDNYRKVLDQIGVGGADLLLVETIFDTLNAKAALYAIAEAIEARAVDRARGAISSLLDLSPPQAEVQTAGGLWQSLAVEQVALGSVVPTSPLRMAVRPPVASLTSTVARLPSAVVALAVQKPYFFCRS